ncbi:MAG: neutral/alkaline non-lysosomal ceramidase N-terminal domain-containing protein, partial [Acidobacteriota bacterium]|nr:neutral/alkaline non-lysosomal ceramidase N-terminal domain-containing protein [Acidobacteriota bacterium]
ASLASAQTLQVGTAQTVITPPAGMPMAGYYSTRLLKGVHDDLHAKAIVMSSGNNKAALVACDLIGIPPGVIEEARQMIQAGTGIPGSNVMISATHSHTGPLIPDGGSRAAAYGAQLPVAKQYRKDLPRKIAESVRLANAKLAPARVSFGKGKDDSVSFNRRFFLKDGTVGWNSGKLNPNIVKPAGPIDPEVPVVLFESESGQPLATYVNFAMHLDTVGGMEASADYPYTLANVLGKVKGPDMLTVFTIGTAGNINHVDVKSAAPQKGHEESARLGTVLAGEVLKTYTRLRPALASTLQAVSRTVALEPAHLEPGDEERAKATARKLDSGEKVAFLDTVNAFKVLDTVARQGKPLDAEVQVIALGDQIAWVGLPGEVFTELGTAIKQASPFPLTIVAELAHGPVTYIPNEAAFPQGNYEVVSSRAAKGSGEKLVAAANALLNETYPPRQHAITPHEKITLFNGRNLDGWYTWLREGRYQDPKKVFSVQDGAIRVSGEEWGGLATKQTYRDYHLIVEWKWGGPTHGERIGKARDSGILVHALGEDGAYSSTWLESVESQVIEGGTGDFIMVGGRRQPSLTAKVREGAKGELYWDENGKPMTRDKGRFDWYGRDPDWKDVTGFRGKQDVENPVGEWNRSEVICDGDTIRNILNGKVVNYGTNSSHTFGKIQLQSEGAEIWFRRVELLPLNK